jgi:hypothetical protein
LVQILDHEPDLSTEKVYTVPTIAYTETGFWESLRVGTRMDNLRLVEIADKAPTVESENGNNGGGKQAQMHVEVTCAPASEAEKRLIEELFDWLFTEANREPDSELIAA